MNDPSDDSTVDATERFDVGGGRTLEIRPTTAADGELIFELYESLSPDDRRLRFFGSFHPRLEWCRDWADIAARGGFGVIALVRGEPDGDNGPVQIAAEAGYALRPDGDGDFAVTVATPWRGWLGPYLVDRLIRHAAATGTANLQADVKLENGPMLSILRRRDPVAWGHDDGAVHLSIGTTTTASWPPHESRRRVLVATTGSRWSGERAADRSGLATVMCPGPARLTRHGCPVLSGGRCPLADGADVIVVLLDPDDDRTARLIESHRRLLPGTPILARRPSASAQDDERGGAVERDVEQPRSTTLPNGCTEIALSGAETVAQVLSLVGDRRAAGGSAGGDDHRDHPDEVDREERER